MQRFISGAPGGGGRGALRYAGVHMHEKKVLKYTPKHILVKMQNSPPKHRFCLKFDPLNMLSLKNFNKFWQNHPLLPETWHFRPLNMFPALRILLQQIPPCTCFLFTHVYTNIFEWPPGSGASYRIVSKHKELQSYNDIQNRGHVESVDTVLWWLSIHSYTPRTLRACCSQSKFRILKICESSARALFLYNCTPNISRSADTSVSIT